MGTLRTRLLHPLLQQIGIVDQVLVSTNSGSYLSSSKALIVTEKQDLRAANVEEGLSFLGWPFLRFATSLKKHQQQCIVSRGIEHRSSFSSLCLFKEYLWERDSHEVLHFLKGLVSCSAGHVDLMTALQCKLTKEVRSL